MSPRTVLLLACLALPACAPRAPVLPPAPEGSAYAFKEWLPGGVPSYLEGQVYVTEGGLVVTTRRERCREVPGLPTSTMQQFYCGGVLLSFHRESPTQLAVYRYTATTYTTTQRMCTTPPPGGNAGLCTGFQTVTHAQQEPRSGRIRLVPIT